MPGIGIPVDIQLTGQTPGELARTARLAEGAGLSRIWVPELERSSVVSLAIAAGATSRIELASGVVLAFTRSPMVTALEALDIDQLSGGRFVLGLGAGVRRLNEAWHAVDYHPPVGRMRETVAAIRELIGALIEQRDAASAGRHVAVNVVGFRRSAPAPRAELPIWLAAMRPGMAALAGECADGLLDHPITTKRWFDEVLVPAVDRGAERAGRRPPPIAGAMICAVDDDRARATYAAALTVGFYASVKTYHELFAAEGFADRLPGVRRAFISGSQDDLVEAVGERMTDAFAAVGTPEQVRARAREIYGARAARLWATPPHHGQSADRLAHWQAGIRRAFGD